MTTVSVLVPWRPGCPDRQRAWAWVRHRYHDDHPDWQIVLGASPDGPFSRSSAILDAAGRADGDLLVVTDADVFLAGDLAVTFEHLEHGWAVPHLMLHRLSCRSTEELYAGADWRRLPLSTDNEQDSRPYRGNETGTLCVFTSDALREAPPDPRFRGWGQEDQAWAYALRTLLGSPWRGVDDLVHLWHPAEPRKNRRIGNDANLALFHRYRLARGRPAVTRALIDETRVSAGNNGGGGHGPARDR